MENDFAIMPLFAILVFKPKISQNQTSQTKPKIHNLAKSSTKQNPKKESKCQMRQTRTQI